VVNTLCVIRCIDEAASKPLHQLLKVFVDRGKEVAGPYFPAFLGLTAFGLSGFFICTGMKQSSCNSAGALAGGLNRSVPGHGFLCSGSVLHPGFLMVNQQVP